MIIKPEELKIVYEKEDDGRIRPVYFIDVEPVVRCKDCKYRDANGCYCQVLGDMFIHWEDWTPVPDDFFCARGTRS